jgi:hypothetical protein
MTPNKSPLVPPYSKGPVRYDSLTVVRTWIVPWGFLNKIMALAPERTKTYRRIF